MSRSPGEYYPVTYGGVEFQICDSEIRADNIPVLESLAAEKRRGDPRRPVLMAKAAWLQTKFPDSEHPK